MSSMSTCTTMDDLALKDLFFATIPMMLLYFLLDWLLRKPRLPDMGGKYVLITGCDTGFGRQAALRLDKLGCHVFAGCLTEEGLMEISNEASDLVIPMKLDVANKDNIKRVHSIITRLLPEGRGLWGVVNNAGMTGPVGPYAWQTDEQIRHVMDVNVMGTINVVNTFLPLLKQAKGRIVNVSSILGLLVTPYTGPYCMAKHAVEAYSDAIRQELYPFGISVSIIEPGGHMQTSFMDKLPTNAQKAWETLSPQLQEEYGFSFLQQVLFLLTKVIPFIASSKPEHVVAAYEHALFARFPRSRYLIGRDAKVLNKLRLVPTWILDRAIHLPGLRAVPESLMDKPKEQ